MTSNGDRYPSPSSAPNAQRGTSHGNGDGFDYSLDNPRFGEGDILSGHADGPVRINGDGWDGAATSDGASLNSKPGSSDDFKVTGSGGSLPYSGANEERLANLIELNNTLVRKVTTLRGDKETLTEKLAHLDEQLRAVRASQALEAQEAVHALEVEKKELLGETKRLEVELQAFVSEKETLVNRAEASRQFIQELEKDRSALLAEKVALEETNRISESKAKDALKACEVLRVEHVGVLNEKGQQEHRIRELEMERMSVETEVTQVTSNLTELKRMHDELLKEQLDLERDSYEKNMQYRTEMEQARKIILALETRNDVLSQGLKQLEAEKLAAVEAEGVMVRRAAELDEEKAAVLAQQLALLDEKRQIELALKESEHQLVLFRSRIQEAEQASTASTSALTRLKQELEALHHLHEELSKEHRSLQGEHSQAIRENRKVSTSNTELEDQLHTTEGSLKVAEEQLHESKRSIERLRLDLEREREETHRVEVSLAEASTELKHVSGELEKEREEKQRVESSLEGTSEELEAVSREKEELQLRVRDLEEKVANVAEELSIAGIKAEEAAQRIEKEVKTSGALQAEVGSLSTVKQTLEEELEEAKSCILAMQSDLGSTRTTLTDLQLQLSDFLKERKSLSDVQSNLELELRRMSTTSSEAAEKVEEELRMWRDKVEELADSLEKARMTASTNEKRAWALMSELQGLKYTLHSNSKWSKFFYPAAAVSGAAALAAGMTFFKYKHPS